MNTTYLILMFKTGNPLFFGPVDEYEALKTLTAKQSALYPEADTALLRFSPDFGPSIITWGDL